MKHSLICLLLFASMAACSQEKTIESAATAPAAVLESAAVSPELVEKADSLQSNNVQQMAREIDHLLEGI